jgi:hypothetical protein
LKRRVTTNPHGIELHVQDYDIVGQRLHERDYSFTVTGRNWAVSCSWYPEKQAAVAGACARAAKSIRASD